MPDVPEVQRAFRVVRVLYVAMAVTAAWVWIAPRIGSLASIALPVGIGLASVCVIVAIAAIATSAAVLRRKTGFDLDFLVGALWLPAMFALLMPGVQPLGLILGVIRLRRDTIGGYSTVKQGSTTHYPLRNVSGGEARPFGYTMLAIGTLWLVVLGGLAVRLFV